MLEASISVGIVALLVLFVVMNHKGMVRSRTNAKATWARVEPLLTERHALAKRLLELLERAPGFAQDALAALRTALLHAQDAGRPAARALAENELATALDKTFAAAERHPELAAHGPFGALRQQAVTAEQQIGAARKTYNEAARDYNFRLRSKLGALIAGASYLKPVEEFKIRD